MAEIVRYEGPQDGQPSQLAVLVWRRIRFRELDDVNQLPDAGSSIEVKGRSMAILISDND
jgi:hypothetical protein